MTANMLRELSDVWVQGMRTTDSMKKAALSFSPVELCIPQKLRFDFQTFCVAIFI